MRLLAAICVAMTICLARAVLVPGSIALADAIHSCNIVLFALMHTQPEPLPLMVTRLLMLLLMRAPGTCRL